MEERVRVRVVGEKRRDKYGWRGKVEEKVDGKDCGKEGGTRLEARERNMAWKGLG